MKYLLKLEELGMFIAALLLFLYLGQSILLFLVLILLPDLGMVGYLFNPKIGAYTYNFTHHKGVAILLFLTGFYLKIDILLIVGIIIFAHSSLDRVLGYGLKYKDSFNNTHLGKIGKNN